MTSILADRGAYTIEPRLVHKKGGKPLTGFAVDVTARFNKDGKPFLEDHNGTRNTMPFDDVDELIKFLGEQIRRNHDEHYAAAQD